MTEDMNEVEKPLVIEDAIEQCIALANHHNSRSTYLLFMVGGAFVLMLALGFFFIFQNTLLKPDNQLSDVFAYLIFGSFVTVFAVLMATHRFHLVEASRMNHTRIGFMRVRVAGRSTWESFQGEVRRALTDGAFPSSESTNVLGAFRSRQIVESPLPGHPGLDLSAQVISQVLEKLDISVKPKDRSKT